MRTIGKYVIRGHLGRGASATVYKARLPVVDRLVAVKVLTPDETLLALLGEAELRSRFTAEARLLAAIEHPRLAAVLDYDLDAHGRPFYVMNYFCQNLGTLLGETYVADRPSRIVPVERAVRYALQILDGLSRLHDAGYLHRDVKPFNVMLDAEDQVKLIDLGLSTLRGEVRPGPKNLKVGTPFYSAPEQEEDPAAADERADLYGLGLTLWRMLTGRLPAERRADSRPPSRDNGLLDAEFDAFLCRAVHPDRARRFPSARTMAQALAALFSAWQARQARACRLAGPATPLAIPVPRLLRSTPLKVPLAAAVRLFPMDALGRPRTTPHHPLTDQGDGTVLDPATHLLWQRAGSPWPLRRPEAQTYVAGLNAARFAGRDDWRLPTVDELLSVLRPGAGPDPADWCAEPALDPGQRWLWSADRKSFTSAWYADTRLGFVAAQDCDCRLHARAVATAGAA